MQHPLTPSRLLTALCVTAALVGCAKNTTPAPVGMEQTSSSMMQVSSSAAMPHTTAEKIANAMSAAVPSVSADATIMDWPATASGDLIELRKGTNGWTCLPDSPETPGNDPICADGMSMKWFEAWMTKTDPKITEDGVAYMLQGGSDASNTDPFATKPAPGEDWMNAPGHVMIFPAGGKLDSKVFSTKMDGGGPWIMFAGTPYQHLMVPVK